MKKNVLAIMSVFAFAFLISSNSFAQSGDDYVRNTKTVPEVTASGWTHDPTTDKVEGEFVTELYVNNGLKLRAFVQVRNRNGSREELFMAFGSVQVGRAALKVDGVWYVGKAPFYDHPNGKKEYDIQMEPVSDSYGTPVAVKLSLETLDGLKSLVVSLK